MKTKSVSQIGRMAVCLACLGMAVPQSVLASGNATMPSDLRLSPNGSLTGRVVDAQGKGISGTVVVSYNGVTIANARTTSAGRFTISGMRGGVHHLTVGGRTSVARVWSSGAAPQSAKSAAVLVSGNIIRSQGCGEEACATCPPMMVDGCGEGCGESCGPPSGLLGGGFLNGHGTGGLLVGGLVVGGIATAIAVAADDDDDPPASP